MLRQLFVLLVVCPAVGVILEKLIAWAVWGMP
jgi:hypothetical protein